jgi:hypothetical protein
MEVHAHSHSSASTVPIAIGRKKWTHYFWEFLMLFLAVFCGFLAEYKLEHLIEHQREKQYMKSMINDLQHDKENLRQSIEGSRRKVLHLDSLMDLLENKMYKGNEKNFYRYARHYFLRYHFRYNDGTIQQLKNAGGMRLVRNRKVVDSINQYDALVKFRKTNESYEDDYIQQMYTFMNRLFDAKKVMKITARMDSISNFGNIDSINVARQFFFDFDSLDIPALQISEEDRKLLISHILTLLIFNENYIRYRIELYQAAEKLKVFIKKEYKLSEGTPMEK